MSEGSDWWYVWIVFVFLGVLLRILFVKFNFIDEVFNFPRGKSEST